MNIQDGIGLGKFEPDEGIGLGFLDGYGIGENYEY